MATRNVIHVTRRGDGRWQLTTPGAARSGRNFPRKADAVKAAKEQAMSAGLGQVVVYGVDGRIQAEHTYGQDPPRTAG